MSALGVARPDAALVLELAADNVECPGWCRPSGAEILLGVIDDHGTHWRGVGDDLPPEALTIVGALHRVTGVEVLSWADLASAPLRPLWDALVLAVGSVTGIWDAPRTGLQVIESVIRWERTVATGADVIAVLRLAADYAARGAVEIECPECAYDPRPGETSRGETCPTCRGECRLRLDRHRWRRLAVVRVIA